MIDSIKQARFYVDLATAEIGNELDTYRGQTKDDLELVAQRLERISKELRDSIRQLTNLRGDRDRPKCVNPYGKEIKPWEVGC